jgi:iron complex transport system permease protein
VSAPEALGVPGVRAGRAGAGHDRLRPLWLAAAAALLVAAVAAGVLVGPAGLSFGDIVSEVASHIPFLGVRSGLDEQGATILWELRMPRVALGALVGAALALAGGAYQGAFRNPLADPYLLGVAAGAGLGATIAIVSRAQGASPEVIPPAAFAGGLAAAALAYGLGRSRLGDRSVVSLVLAGVAITVFLTAIQTFLQQWRWETLQQVYSFILGGLGSGDWRQVGVVLPYVLVSGGVLLACARRLDVLAVGDPEAESLGVHVVRLRLLVVLAATVLTSAAVAVSGLIGFIGLVVPHAIRLMTGAASNRVLLPLTALGGAAFLIGCDVIARTALAPAELPIGVVTAFFGAPFFLVVLRTSREVW